MKRFKKFICLLLSLLTICACLVISAEASESAPPILCGTQYTKVDSNGYYKVRFIATTNEELSDLSEIGFDLTVNYSDGGTEINDVKERYSCKYVYSSINAVEDGKNVTYSAEKLGGKYIFILSVKDVPESAGKITFTATPYTVAADGETTAQGEACKMVYDSGDYADTVSAMSFNVYVGNGHPDLSDTERAAQAEKITKIVEDEEPDLVGFQEVSSYAGTLGLLGYRGFWNDYIKTYENDYGVVGYDYETLGYNNYDTGWVDSPLLYARDKFTLVEGGMKWPSDTPDVNGSKVDGAAEPRPYTYAILERKLDGVRFAVVNAHLDYSSSAVRYEQALRISAFLSDSRFDGLPIILMGDLNEKYQSKTVDTLIGNGFINSAEAAEETEILGRTSIDFILVNDTVDVSLYKEINTLTGPDGETTGAKWWDEDGNVTATAYISDHNALYVEFIFRESDVREKTDSSVEYLPPVFPSY